MEMAAMESPREAIDLELRPVLFEEINRLPEKYRTPVVLCYLQGRTNEEAARQLAWPVGTVKDRLTRARALLRQRLTRRGLGLSLGAFGTVLTHGTASAVPAVLVDSTVKAAMLVAAGQAAMAGVVSAQVAALTKGVLQTMFVTKLAIAGTVLLAVSFVGAGAGLLTHRTPAAEPGLPKKTARPEVAAIPKDVPENAADDESEDKALKLSQSNLKDIMLAMMQPEVANGRFPAAAIYDRDGKALLSWRVTILPYLSEEALFRQFKLDEPWDSAHNKKLLAGMPKIYAPPRGKYPANSTVYQVFTGKGTAFASKQGARLEQDIPDGTANTIGIVEAAEAVPWTKPADLPYDPNKPLPKLGGMFKDVFNACFMDASVHVLKRKADERILRAAITADGGERYDLGKIEVRK
jgi:hypothetical protein